MADIRETIAAHPASGTPNTKTILWRDMGNDTHAQVIAVIALASPGTDIGTVHIAANAGVNIGTVHVAANPGVNLGDVRIASIAANDGVDIGDVDVASVAGDVSVQPFSALLEGGLTELVGINEEVNTNDFGGSVGVALGDTYSGEILSFAFYATEDGSGAVQDSAGKLIILDADPEVSAGDTALAAAEWPTVLGIVDVGASDWVTDANGGCAFIYDQPVPFHALSTLYFVWLHTDSTDLNDAAGDDEQLEFNFWYRRDS